MLASAGVATIPQVPAWVTVPMPAGPEVEAPVIVPVPVAIRDEPEVVVSPPARQPSSQSQSSVAFPESDSDIDEPSTSIARGSLSPVSDDLVHHTPTSAGAAVPSSAAAAAAATAHVAVSVPPPVSVSPDPVAPWTRAVLLLVPLRLGLAARIQPQHVPALQRCLALPYSVGLVGGKPGASFYFVGTQGDRLFYLDPHTVQDALPMDADLMSDASSFECATVRSMPGAHLDPSVALGFYCRSQADVQHCWTCLLEVAGGPASAAPLFSLSASSTARQYSRRATATATAGSGSGSAGRGNSERAPNARGASLSNQLGPVTPPAREDEDDFVLL